MAKGRLIAFSNPISPDRETEYNEWYNGIHAEDVMRLPGVVAMKRYKAVAELNPVGEPVRHQYVAIYELDDIDAAMAGFATAAATFNISDSMNMTTASVLAYAEIYEYKS